MIGLHAHKLTTQGEVLISAVAQLGPAKGGLKLNIGFVWHLMMALVNIKMTILRMVSTLHISAVFVAT